MPKYKISDPFFPTVWREAATMREAYRYAYNAARVARRCNVGFTARITRVYDGDNAEYRANPITRTVTAWG